jgi:hypothetical protein
MLRKRNFLFYLSTLHKSYGSGSGFHKVPEPVSQPWLLTFILVSNDFMVKITKFIIFDNFAGQLRIWIKIRISWVPAPEPQHYAHYLRR